MTFLLPFTRVDTLARPILSLALYTLHTCLHPFMPLFLLCILEALSIPGCRDATK